MLKQPVLVGLFLNQRGNPFIGKPFVEFKRFAGQDGIECGRGTLVEPDMVTEKGKSFKLFGQIRICLQHFTNDVTLQAVSQQVNQIGFTGKRKDCRINCLIHDSAR